MVSTQLPSPAASGRAGGALRYGRVEHEGPAGIITWISEMDSRTGGPEDGYVSIVNELPWTCIAVSLIVTKAMSLMLLLPKCVPGCLITRLFH